MQRILYNPTQTPAKATPEAVQAQAAGQGGPEQGSRHLEPASDHVAGNGTAGQSDILDQLMGDGTVQDEPVARADDAVQYSTTGDALAPIHYWGLFQPV